MGTSVRNRIMYSKGNGRIRSCFRICPDIFGGLTNTLPLHVEILFNEFQYVPAFAVSSDSGDHGGDPSDHTKRHGTSGAKRRKPNVRGIKRYQ